MIQNKINDGKKIIRVIDTSFSSFILEKIFEGYNNFDEIVEIKKDLGETRLQAKNILKISKKKIIFKNKFVITSSVTFSWTRNRFLNILKFRKLQKNIFKKICFKKNHIYIGSKTSTIMNVLPKSNRILIDHGFSDYNHKANKILISKKIIDIMKERIANLIGYPYMSLNEDMNGYTVCKIPKFSNNFIDMQNLPINKIVKNFFSNIKKKYPRINTIFLLTKNWEANHYKSSRTEIEYDSINLELIKKYVSKGQKFFIKFHEFTIRSNQTNSSFIKKACLLGYHAVDIDSHLKTCFKGMIPAELLISRLKLKRVISKYSSTLHNICHNTSLDCTMDINPELQVMNNYPKHYKIKLLKEFNERYSFNKLTGGKVNIRPIHK